MVFAYTNDLDLDLYRGSDQGSASAYDRTYFLNSKSDLKISIKMCGGSIAYKILRMYN